MRFCRPSLLFIVSAVLVIVGAGTANCERDDSDSTPAPITEYMETAPDSPIAYALPQLGIEVKDGDGTLQRRHRFDGVEILEVISGSPAAAAGLHGKKEQVQAALTVSLLLAAMFFPPAMICAAALGASGIGQSQELIIAVDGERTYDITDLEAALDQAKPGELVYLTVVSGGRRKQLTMVIPNGQSQPIGGKAKSAAW